MGDVFLEQLIKRKDTFQTMILKFLIMLAGAIVFIFSLLFITSKLFGPFALLLGVGAIYIAWHFATGMNLEFEYIYTNGEIDFDKIIAKRKRKRLITVRISSFDDFGKYDAQKMKDKNFDIKINAATSLEDPDTYYATFRNRDGKNSILMFTPSEKLLETINVQYRRKSYGR